MNRPLALALLVAGFVAATSPVWALPVDNPRFDPERATPGATVTFSGQVPSPSVLAGVGACTVTTSPYVPLTYTCAYDATGAISGRVVVPTDWPETALPLTLCGPRTCEKFTTHDGFWYLHHTLAVGTVDPKLVTVPTVVCSPAGSARTSLQEAGLAVATPGSDFVVGSQAPAPGARVTPGAGATLYPARVPPVAGLAFPSASAVITAACGSPVAVGGTAGTVRRQSPLPTSAMPADRLVTVVMGHRGEPPAPPPPPPPPWWQAPAAAAVAAVVATTATWWVWRLLHARPRVRARPEQIRVTSRRGLSTCSPLSSTPSDTTPTVTVVRRAAIYRSGEST
jgi:hypothetical protein